MEATVATSFHIVLLHFPRKAALNWFPFRNVRPSPSMSWSAKYPENTALASIWYPKIWAWICKLPYDGAAAVSESWSSPSDGNFSLPALRFNARDVGLCLCFVLMSGVAVWVFLGSDSNSKMFPSDGFSFFNGRKYMPKGLHEFEVFSSKWNHLRPFEKRSTTRDKKVRMIEEDLGAAKQ